MALLTIQRITREYVYRNRSWILWSKETDFQNAIFDALCVCVYTSLMEH